MEIEHYRTIKIKELDHLVPTNAGATFSQLWQIFYYTRMFRYMSYRNFTQIKTSYNKICTYDKLHSLCELGYFKSPQRAVYCATNKVLPILKEVGYPVELLPAEATGFGDINELKNTDVFVKTVKLPFFKILLFPRFKNLIPDALLVQLDEENRKYKLTFLEIEASKSKWHEYLFDKKEKYVKLAKELDFYNSWNEIAPKLGLPIPKISDFKFSVVFVCTIKKDFGKGFKFVSDINNV